MEHVSSDEMLQVIEDLVGQHCRRDGGALTDFGLSANEAALKLLERAGIVKEVALGCYEFYWDIHTSSSPTPNVA
jgi:hypothetical protein